MSGPQVFVVSDGDSVWDQALECCANDIYHLPAYCRVSARADGGNAGAVVAHNRGDIICFHTFDGKSTERYGMPRRHVDTAGQSGRLSVADVCHVPRRLWLITLSSLYTPVRLQATVSARTEGGPLVSA
jgi:hypothetical protein